MSTISLIKINRPLIIITIINTMLTNWPFSKETSSRRQHSINKLHKNVAITLLRIATIHGISTQNITLSIIASGDTIIERNYRKVCIVAGEVKWLFEEVTG